MQATQFPTQDNKFPTQPSQFPAQTIQVVPPCSNVKTEPGRQQQPVVTNIGTPYLGYDVHGQSILRLF